MSAIECFCWICHPEYLPTGPRQNEGHIADRFGDFKGPTYAGAYVQPFLDGKPISGAIEVIPGDPGVIVALYLPIDTVPIECPCGSTELCLMVHTGRVSIERMWQVAQ